MERAIGETSRGGALARLSFGRPAPSNRGFVSWCRDHRELWNPAEDTMRALEPIMSWGSILVGVVAAWLWYHASTVVIHKGDTK
jgi:hypothetical protein